MGLEIRRQLGWTEAVIAEDGDVRLFYKAADILNSQLKIKFVHKQDEVYSINWTFKYKGQSMVLQHDIYNGISVVAERSQTNEKGDAIMEALAQSLKGRLNENELENLSV